MSLKRKRDVADTSAAQVPLDTLLTGLKDSDVQRLQACLSSPLCSAWCRWSDTLSSSCATAANGTLRLLSLLRKADPSVEAKKLEKHLSTQNGFPELKTALETIRQVNTCLTYDGAALMWDLLTVRQPKCARNTLQSVFFHP